MPIRICAIADIHAPRNLQLFYKALEAITTSPDLFLLAGDTVEKGKVKEFSSVLDLLEKWECPILSIFGNEEYDQRFDLFRSEYPQVQFLDDEILNLRIKEVSLSVVGTRGSLDRLTKWQARNRPEFRQIFKKRIETVARLLRTAQADFKILISHFAPTYRTMQGEDSRFYSYLGSNRFEEVIQQNKPDLVIHGHIHHGITGIFVDSIPVWNVSLPSLGKIAEITLNKDMKRKIIHGPSFSFPIVLGESTKTSLRVDLLPSLEGAATVQFHLSKSLEHGYLKLAYGYLPYNISLFVYNIREFLRGGVTKALNCDLWSRNSMFQGVLPSGEQYPNAEGADINHDWLIVDWGTYHLHNGILTLNLEANGQLEYTVQFLDTIKIESKPGKKQFKTLYKLIPLKKTVTLNQWIKK
ncbi:MAG: metallophosphoesterase [Candidatus Hodarchaeota archaeon]